MSPLEPGTDEAYAVFEARKLLETVVEYGN